MSALPLNQIETAMAELPAFDPDTHRGDVEDEFADSLSGNVYPRTPARPRNGLYGIAHGQLLNLAEGGKSELVRNIAGIVDMVRTVTAQVESLGVEPFAGYARSAAALVDDLEGSIADKSVEALIDDGRALVRQQPEIAIAAAAIIGFVGARIVKARS